MEVRLGKKLLTMKLVANCSSEQKHSCGGRRSSGTCSRRCLRAFGMAYPARLGGISWLGFLFEDGICWVAKLCFLNCCTIRACLARFLTECAFGTMNDFLALEICMVHSRMRAFKMYLFECFSECTLGAKRISTSAQCSYIDRMRTRRKIR